MDSGKFEGVIDVDDVEKASAMSMRTGQDGAWDVMESEFDDPNLDRAHIVLGQFIMILCRTVSLIMFYHSTARA